MAGERRGRGLRGRIEVYGRGRGAVSGLGEAAMDRALADPEWLADRLQAERDGHPARAKDWAGLAIEWADVHVRWATTADRSGAATLERQVLDVLAGYALWNRAR